MGGRDRTFLRFYLLVSPGGFFCLFLGDDPAARSDTNFDRGLIFPPGLRLAGDLSLLDAGEGEGDGAGD